MKKLVAILVAMMFVLGMTACGGSNGSDTGLGTDGKLVVGTEAGFAPYEYMSGDEVVGVDMDICQAIADEMGVELEIKNMDFDGALAAVQSGKVDIVAAGVSVSEERLEVMNFTTKYVDSKEVVVVNGANPAVEASEDGIVLDGLTVGVQQGNIADSWVSNEDNCAPAEVKRYTKFSQAAEDLKNGKIDCIVMDENPAKELVASNDGLEIIDGILFEDSYAIAVNKDNQVLLDTINPIIEKLIEDGTIDEFMANHSSAK